MDSDAAGNQRPTPSRRPRGSSTAAQVVAGAYRVQPSARDRVDLGLVLPGVAPTVGSATHRVAHSFPDDKDEEVIRWLQAAYGGRPLAELPFLAPSADPVLHGHRNAERLLVGRHAGWLRRDRHPARHWPPPRHRHGHGLDARWCHRSVGNHRHNPVSG